MSKRSNITESRTIRITLSAQSEALLEELATQGIYGRNAADVAGRFVDRALQHLVETDRLQIPVVKRDEPRRER